MRKTIFLIFLSFYISANCQNSVDKIVVTKNLLAARFNSSDSLYKSENKIITNKKVISKILEELKKIDNKNYLLAKYKIDTAYIKNNPEKLLKLYSNKLEIDWNTQQKKFIFKELQDVENFKKQLLDYLSNGCCYTMHNHYRNQIDIEVYKNNTIINKYSSRKYSWGYAMPWTGESDTIYNYEVERIINHLFNVPQKIKEPIEGDELLKYLVNKIIDNNIKNLYKLSAYSYQEEIEELKSTFNILSFEEVYGRGRYIWDEPKTLKISLQNIEMLPNVYLQFLASETGNTIYSRDSIIKNYKNIVTRVQNIKFIKSYLARNTNSKLDIYYFNNKPINNYNIESVNKNPIEWKKQDDYVAGLNWYEKNNVKPSFDLNEAIKTSQMNHCGCNYRFEKSFIEKGIFFEFFDEEDNTSIWILLPDNNVLLYIMDGEKALDLNLTEFEKSWGIKYPCKLFNSEGAEIKN
ncbi:hypothetical protein FLJC2902T_32090 [Flavobacterium limnosediminis JC2902]|uniref:Uncharacterized protein n=1 Tax=Flavobacterium limnosediminis JC2902 TaxID=1341181 RepID=V6SBJ8_9FLAO|nr:hypothetical protein [Flavobacterium limnosediminis]ESU24011.1 hypothetical protein FLJC2902T_32090 [Flavobacterium limnosediminis JC2902]